ncbi:DoxX family protein [Undibacterium seohonense]|jgi:putative oxidoreductase|uniref:DoxX family protein n=1 Tax=Undibacterium seohonense TaxID=1344950 RepID=A0ABR6X1N3_9BURK|nr:DoxX family protein [Undibacterium seohonense]MBC3806855.1 DoxX family protein [Undibacterium seohonense]
MPIPFQKQLSTALISDANGGIAIVRIGVALIILMHPLHGYFHLENIPRFGEYLSGLGYPMGGLLAWLVLLIQTLSSVGLLLNRYVLPACMGHMVIISFGLVHVHAQYGWYVVGPGQGGMEWGFILLTALSAVMWAYWPRTAPAK